MRSDCKKTVLCGAMMNCDQRGMTARSKKGFSFGSFGMPTVYGAATVPCPFCRPVWKTTARSKGMRVGSWSSSSRRHSSS